MSGATMSSVDRGRRLRRVGLVLTGGTIGSEIASPLPQEKLVRLLDAAGNQIPEFELVQEALPRGGEFEFDVRRPVGMLSEDLAPENWSAMAASIRGLVEDEGADGILILHGTDTMAYTSAALSFMLSDLRVPIVVTGSNRPSDQPRSDAVRNLRASLIALENLGPGVFIVFAGRPDGTGRVHIGTRVRKVRASGNAFASVGRRPVAEVRNDEFLPIWTPHLPLPTPLRGDVDGRVLSLRVYPGLDLGAILDVLVPDRVRGVVIELYASFTSPSSRPRYSVPRFADACSNRGVPVVAAVANEPTGKPNLYESRVAFEEAGGAILHMLPETATVKLMWALAIDSRPTAVLDLMSTSVANEMSNA